MNTTVLALETKEGTYQLGSLVPNPHNEVPQREIAANSFAGPEAGGRSAKRLPDAIKGPWVVAMITPLAGENDEDEEPLTILYRVVCMPLRGWEHQHMGMPLLIEIPSEDVRRAYMTMSLDDAFEYMRELQEEPEEASEEPGNGESDSLPYAMPVAPSRTEMPAFAPPSASLPVDQTGETTDAAPQE